MQEQVGALEGFGDMAQGSGDRNLRWIWNIAAGRFAVVTARSTLHRVL